MPPCPFFSERTTFALYGMSRTRSKFGNLLYRHLTDHGYTIFPIHPDADTVQGVKAYPSLAALPRPPEGVIINLPAPRALEAVHAAADTGISAVFLQQGAESPEVLELCRQRGVRAFYGSCAILNSRPTGFHAIHAFFARFLGGWAKEQPPSSDK